MDVNHELQVWLEVDGQQNPPVIIPMVQSPVAQPAQYRIEAQRQGEGGVATIRTSGQMLLPARQAVALSRLAFGGHPASACYIELVLQLADHNENTYRFNCP